MITERGKAVRSGRTRSTDLAAVRPRTGRVAPIRRRARGGGLGSRRHTGRRAILAGAVAGKARIVRGSRATVRAAATGHAGTLTVVAPVIASGRELVGRRGGRAGWHLTSAVRRRRRPGGVG